MNSLDTFLWPKKKNPSTAAFRFPQVDDETVSLPLLREPHVYIERQSNTILLNTNIGLKVRSSHRGG